MDDTPRRRTRAKFLKAKKPVQKQETKVIETPREQEVAVSPEETDAVEVEIELPLEDVMDTGEESIQEEVVRIETGSLNISPSRSQHDEAYPSHTMFSPARDSTGGSPTSSSLYRKTADLVSLSINVKEKVAIEENNVRIKNEESSQVGIKDKGDLVSQEQLQEEHSLLKKKCMGGHFNIEKEYEIHGNGKFLERKEELDHYSMNEKVQGFLDVDVKHEERVLKVVSDSIMEVQDKIFVEESWSESLVEKSKSETVGEKVQNVTDVEEMQDETITKNLQSEALIDEVHSNEDGKEVQNEISEEDIRYELIMEAVQSETVVEDGQSEAVVEDMQSETVVEDLQSEAIVKDMQSEAVVEDLQSETVVEDLQSETVVEDLQSETVVEDLQSETVVEDLQSETVVEDLRGETVVEDLRGETVVEDLRGETVVEDLRGETVVEDLRGETVVEDLQGETVFEKLQGETVFEKLQSGAVVEDVQGETATEEVRGETVVEDVQGGAVVEELQSGVVIEDVQGGAVVEDVLGETATEEVRGKTVVEDVQGGAVVEDVLGETATDEVQGGTVAGGVEVINTEHIVAGEECFVANVVFGDKEKLDVSLRVVEDIGATAEVGEMTEEEEAHVDSAKQKESTEQSEKPAGVWDDIEKLAEVACSEFLDNSSKKELVAGKEPINYENSETQSTSSNIASTGLDTAQIGEQKCNIEQPDLITQNLTSPFQKSISERKEQNSWNSNDVRASEQKENIESTESSKLQNNSDYSVFTKNDKESLGRSQPMPSDTLGQTSSEEIKTKKVESVEQIDSERTEVTELDKFEKVREYSAVEKLENFVRGAPTTDRRTMGRTRKKISSRAKKNVQRTPSVDTESKNANLSDTANKVSPEVTSTPVEIKKEGVENENSCKTTSTDGTTAHFKTVSKHELNKGGTKRKRSASSVDNESRAIFPRTPTRVEENVEFPKLENESYKKPFQNGWKREIVFRAIVEGKVQTKKGRMADIYYFAPTGQKLRSVKEVEIFMEKNPDHQLPMTYFTFGKYSVYHEPFEVQRLANFKSKTPEVHSSDQTPIPKKKVSTPKTPETKTSVPVVTDTPKKPSDNIPTSKGEKRRGPRIKYTPKRFKEDVPSPELQKPAPPLTKVQTVTTTKSDSSKSEQTEVKKQVIAKKNENVEMKKQNSQKTYSLLTNLKMDSTEAVLCSLHCVGRNGQLPSLHCGVCLCLFHPECVGVAPTSRPSIFICQRCRKNIKEGKARLPPPGARPIIPQESHSSESKHTEQTSVESKSLHNGKIEEETMGSCKSSSNAESKVGTNTGISLVPEVVLTQEHSDEEESMKDSSLAPSLPVRTILPPPPPLTPAPLRSLGLRAVHPVNDFPPRLTYLHRQNSIPNNAFPSFNTGLVPNTSPVSSRAGISGPVVQNVFFMPASSQASPSGPIPIPAMQAPVFIPPSSGTSNVSSSFIPPFPHPSYSTPQLFQALSPQPVLEARTGPNAVVLGSQMIPGAQARVPLPAHNTITNMPLLRNGFFVTGPVERPGPQMTYFPSPTTLPVCTGSLQFQTVTTLAMCCSNSSNTFYTSAVSIPPSSAPLLPQIPSLRPPVCSVVPVCSNKSIVEASTKTSESVRVSHPIDNDGSYVKTSSSSMSPETCKSSLPVSEKVADVQKIESPPVEKKPQVTTQSVGVQSEAPPPSPKKEPVVPETETRGVQTEIKLKDIEVTVDSDWLEEEDSSGEDIVSDKNYYKNKVLVKLREHTYSCDLKRETAKKKLQVEKLKPSFCYMNRLVGGFECVNSIFQYLGVADLLSASQVSRTWRTLATQPFLWKCVCLGDLYITNWALCAKALECFNTTSLDLRDVGHLEDRATFWGYFIRILGHLRNLQHLAFGEVVPEVLPAVSETVTHLQTLTAECVTEATGASVWTTLCKVDFSKIGRLSYLNYLWVRGGGGLRLPSLMSNGGLQSLENLTMLRHLHLTTLVGVPSESFQFIEKLPLLESLAIGNCFSWTRETYALLGKLKQLKKLRLEKGGQLHDTSLQNAISNLTQLEELQLLCFVIPTSLGSGLQKLKHLSRLVMWPDTYRQAPKVNQNTLKAVSSLTKLKKFSWGVMSSQSDLEEMTRTEDNEDEDEHNDREIKMISLLRHKENCKCSESEDGSSDINPECTVMVHLNELEQRLSKLFPKTRITVFRVPLERFSEFCSAFR
ncbi:uncharacterized protein LOC106463188 isoform X2 [Limulus polyphemus]|uniref:Uncharacterized protein LOC106463188 isoform X2 n=1 Tax=Limulus polyphemus TaxID=6850 RepID=A0ABM1SSW7_LIMPO|nr:uncharacterized protein LOC106463188 isoform X2 [Limulus polyphemus]